eukprot:5655944-Alexandrium_andersonii.AAC.1
MAPLITSKCSRIAGDSGFWACHMMQIPCSTSRTAFGLGRPFAPSNWDICPSIRLAETCATSRRDRP